MVPYAHLLAAEPSGQKHSAARIRGAPATIPATPGGIFGKCARLDNRSCQRSPSADAATFGVAVSLGSGLRCPGQLVNSTSTHAGRVAMARKVSNR